MFHPVHRHEVRDVPFVESREPAKVPEQAAKVLKAASENPQSFPDGEFRKRHFQVLKASPSLTAS
jgi:hypothetical protein